MNTRRIEYRLHPADGCTKGAFFYSIHSRWMKDYTSSPIEKVAMTFDIRSHLKSSVSQTSVDQFPTAAQVTRFTVRITPSSTALRMSPSRRIFSSGRHSQNNDISGAWRLLNTDVPNINRRTNPFSLGNNTGFPRRLDPHQTETGDIHC